MHHPKSAGEFEGGGGGAGDVEAGGEAGEGALGGDLTAQKDAGGGVDVNERGGGRRGRLFQLVWLKCRLRHQRRR